MQSFSKMDQRANIIRRGAYLLQYLCESGVFEESYIFGNHGDIFLLKGGPKELNAKGVEVTLAKDFFGLEKGTKLFIKAKKQSSGFVNLPNGPVFIICYKNKENEYENTFGLKWYETKELRNSKMVSFNDVIEEMKTL